MLVFGGSIGNAMLDIMRGNFSLPREAIMDERSMALWLAASGQLALEALFPLLILLLIASILGPDFARRLAVFGRGDGPQSRAE